MTLAKRIRDCRYAKGWGPDELANRAEISRTALYQIECGKTGTPRAGTLRRIARALGVSIDVLMGVTPRNPEHASPRLQAEPGARDEPTSFGHGLDRTPHGPFFVARPATLNRERELERKLHELLASPLGEGVARIVEESHRLLPTALPA